MATIKLEQLTQRDIALMRLVQFKYTQAQLLPRLSDEFTLNLVLGRLDETAPKFDAPLTLEQKTAEIKRLSDEIAQDFKDMNESMGKELNA